MTASNQPPGRQPAQAPHQQPASPRGPSDGEDVNGGDDQRKQPGKDNPGQGGKLGERK